MLDIYDKDDLRQIVEASEVSDLIRKIPVPHREGFYSLKYKNKVFYDNLWTPHLEEMRGMVVDDNYNIVAKPFTKIYNIGIEAQAPHFEDIDPVIVTRKVNGFMAAITWDVERQDIFVSTAGANDPTFVQYIKEMIDFHGAAVIKEASMHLVGHTLMFECVHPKDPHIIPEKKGLYLLDVNSTIKKASNSISAMITDSPRFVENNYLVRLPNLAKAMNVYDCVDKVFNSVVLFSEITDYMQKCKHEGFVVKSAKDDRQGKLKSPYYLSSKFLARKSQVKLEEILDRQHYKRYVDEEFYGLCDYLVNNCKSLFINSSEQGRLEIVRKYFSEKRNA